MTDSPDYADLICHRALHEDGDWYCAAHGQSWPCTPLPKDRGVSDAGREAFVTEMFLHYTYQVAAFSNDPALVQRAAEFHYQFGRHIPTPQPGGCRECRT
jgi:hypothetical protein